jgi:hypothetical protein
MRFSGRRLNLLRETLRLSMARHVIDDQGDHEAVGVAGLEKPYLLVDVMAFRGDGGADNNKSCGGVERYPCLLGQRMPRGKLVPIATGLATYGSSAQLVALKHFQRFIFLN